MDEGIEEFDDYLFEFYDSEQWNTSGVPYCIINQLISEKFEILLGV